MAETLTAKVNDLKAEFADLKARMKAIEDARVAADLAGAVEELSGKIDDLGGKIVGGVTEGAFGDLMAKVDELLAQMKDPRESPAA